MSAPVSLLPAAARSGVRTRTRRHAGPSRELDRVHDHVLRLLGDEAATERVLADVVARSAARAREAGESPTFETLVRLAHARLATVPPSPPDDALLARLAGDREPAGPALVRAVSRLGVPRAALLDLTTRHDVDLRRAAALLGIDRATAARIRTDALHRVRSQLADAGVAVDVETTMARLPVLGAPAAVHHAAAFPAPQRGPVPTPLAWLGAGAAVLGTVAGLTFGLPSLVAANPLDDAPVVVAQGVTEGPAVRQLSTPGDDVPEGGVEQLVVRGPDTEPVAQPSPEATTEVEPTPAPEPTPTEEPSPTPSPAPEEEPSEEASPEPSPEPSEGPLDDLLPTGP